MTQPAGAGARAEDAGVIGRADPITRLLRGLGCKRTAEPRSIATLAHLSDLHATRVRLEHVGQLLSKRALGWLSWRLRRRHRYLPAVLEALLADLAQAAPDQIAITGDLTQISLEDEFAEAAEWLARVGPPERVSAIPGNHDAYVAVPHERSWHRWADYLASDRSAAALCGESEELFPSVRLRGGLAIVGVCTAQPTPPFLASGHIGVEQMARLDRVLARLGEARLCRVVMVHHAPVPGVTSSRRALRDVAAFADVLRRRGAELVLHGHLHRSHHGALPGPERPIPVVGVPSASHAGPHPERCAAYHLYDIEERDGIFAIRRRVRAYDPATGRFAPRETADEWLTGEAAG
jgi:3',5'-cyclic AMP phosphodiesterase CpdA